MRNASRLEKSIKFANKLGLVWPAIVQAPMAGGITTPWLVAAVSNANGMGSFATGYLSVKQVESSLREIKQLTDAPFSVNLFVPNKPKPVLEQLEAYSFELNKFRGVLELPEEKNISTFSEDEDNFAEIVEVLLKEKISIVSFTFGILSEKLIIDFKKNGAYLIGTATSVEEAKLLAQAGVDAVVAQGYEAGGHRGGFSTSPESAEIGTLALIPLIVDSIELPVIAAGGIMDSRGIMAALCLGAAAVQMGTAFLNTQESGASGAYKEMLVKTKQCDYDATTLTAVYTGKIARAIQNDFIKHMEENVISLPPYPLPHLLSSPVRKEATKRSATNIMSMWAGQGVPMIEDSLTTQRFLEKLRSDVKKSFEEFSNISFRQ